MSFIRNNTMYLSQTHHGVYSVGKVLSQGSALPITGTRFGSAPPLHLWRHFLHVNRGQCAHAGHCMHALQPPLLARYHGDGHLAAVVLVDNAVLHALHYAHVVQVLRRVLVARLHRLKDTNAGPLAQEDHHRHYPQGDDDGQHDHFFHVHHVL